MRPECYARCPEEPWPFISIIKHTSKPYVERLSFWRRRKDNLLAPPWSHPTGGSGGSSVPSAREAKTWPTTPSTKLMAKWCWVSIHIFLCCWFKPTKQINYLIWIGHISIEKIIFPKHIINIFDIFVFSNEKSYFRCE